MLHTKVCFITSSWICDSVQYGCWPHPVEGSYRLQLLQVCSFISSYFFSYSYSYSYFYSYSYSKGENQGEDKMAGWQVNKRPSSTCSTDEMGSHQVYRLHGADLLLRLLHLFHHPDLQLPGPWQVYEDFKLHWLQPGFPEHRAEYHHDGEPESQGDGDSQDVQTRTRAKEA